MKMFVVVDTQSGEILVTSLCGDGGDPPEAHKPHQVFELAPGDSVSVGTHYLAEESFIEYSAQERAAKAHCPTFPCAWSNTSMSWHDLRAASQKIADAVADLSHKRVTLLSASDWTQALDSPMSVQKSNEWRGYRQSLRDITDQAGYPLSVVWPTAPDKG